jgi:hypothetical protein
MAEIRPLREEKSGPGRDLSNGLPSSFGRQLTRFCAYNQTGQRFISNEVDVPPASTASLEDLLSILTPGSGKAIWIVPIRTLNATGFRAPVDLLYLDENGLVLEAVQSFPISRVSMPTARAASILALPAHTVLSTGIDEQDRLLISDPDAMQRYLLHTDTLSLEPDHKTHPIRMRITSVPANLPGELEDRERSRTEALPLQWEPFAGNSGAAQERKSASSVPVESQETKSHPVAEADAPRFQKPARRKWWQKLLSDEPTDPRKASREVLPGLVAYFFTGGRPAPHFVRNISRSGLYVQTSESWYLGTIVRMTLTDDRQRAAERSVTLNAKVVRCTDDGVGLHFLFSGKRSGPRDKSAALVDLSTGADRAQFELFLEQYKSGV